MILFTIKYDVVCYFYIVCMVCHKLNLSFEIIT